MYYYLSYLQSTKPAVYIRQMIKSKHHYTKLISKMDEDMDDIHADWIRAWFQTLFKLQVLLLINIFIST